jgi:hypothetical protein
VDFGDDIVPVRDVNDFAFANHVQVFTQIVLEDFDAYSLHDYMVAIVATLVKKARPMGTSRFAEVNKEAESINRDLARLMSAGREAGSSEVRAVVARHHAWIRNFWTPDAASYRGLGRLYVDHPEFRAFYDKAAPGLAEYLCASIERYCVDFPS